MRRRRVAAAWWCAVASAAGAEGPLNESMVRGDGSFAGLYECPEAGEAYSAGYLGRRATFLRHEIPASRLAGGQGNMEGASHAMFRRTRLHKTVDMFDMYVEHLSWYERRLFRASGLRAKVLARLRGQTTHRSSGRPREDAVALMPFYATPGGDSGHSALESRRVFLNLTYESLAPYFGKIAVCVATQFDEDFLRHQSGLDLFDVLRAEVFKPSRLGFATVHHAQQRLLRDARWRDVAYVFYTESDQIFHARNLARLLDIADAPPFNYVIPHRVMPAPLRRDLGRPDADADQTLPPATLREFARNAAKDLRQVPATARAASCCFDRAPCSGDRRHWKPFDHAEIDLFQLVPDQGATHSFQTSFALVAGEGNFLRQHFRPCRLSTDSRSLCRDS